MIAALTDAAPLLVLVLGFVSVMVWHARYERRRRRELQLRVADGSIRSDADLDEVAIYSRALVEAGEELDADVRTWTDLDLDAVFTRIDRTASTAGRSCSTRCCGAGAVRVPIVTRSASASTC